MKAETLELARTEARRLLREHAVRVKAAAEKLVSELVGEEREIVAQAFFDETARAFPEIAAEVFSRPFRP